jgi:hypothetical protein
MREGQRRIVPAVGGFGGPDGGPPNAGGFGGIGGGVGAAAAAAGLGDDAAAEPELRDASFEASMDIMSPPPPPPPMAGLGSSFLPTIGDDLSTVTTFFSAFLPKPWMPARSAELGEAGGGDDEDESDDGMMGGGAETPIGGPAASEQTRETQGETW